jgi:hypothetical protein
MACITFLAPTAMATSQFMPVILCQVPAPRQSERNLDRQPLRMNWVVVTGRNGNRALRMKWSAAKDC